MHPLSLFYRSLKGENKDMYDSTVDTLKHINRVQYYGQNLISNLDLFFENFTGLQRDTYLKFKELLNDRLKKHDASKLTGIEKDGFDKWTQELTKYSYSSDPNSDYMKNLIKMKEFIELHWKNNRHHPEHFENGMRDMNLVDIFEMLCDWLAATERNKNGNIYSSLIENQDRFNYDAITAKMFKDSIPWLTTTDNELPIFDMSLITVLKSFILSFNAFENVLNNNLDDEKTLSLFFVENTRTLLQKELTQ